MTPPRRPPRAAGRGRRELAARAEATRGYAGARLLAALLLISGVTASPSLAAAAAARAAGPASASSLPLARHRASVRQLSDEVHMTYWAYASTLGPIRTRPFFGSARVGAMRLTTPDGLHFPEVYEVLRSYMDRYGQLWLRIRVPMRPNGRTGWVPDWMLGGLHRTRHHLVIDRGRLRATLYAGRRVLWSASIGVGKPSTPTPAGHYWVVEKFVSLAAFYGPFAIGTSAYAPTLSDWPGGGVVGIHGTDQPWLIPGRPSHGCIRLTNPDVSSLYALLPIGTPIRIL